MRVHITDLKPGDRLAQDIFNAYGLHVLSKGAVLNDGELSRLYQHQIEYVEIEWRPSDRSLFPDEMRAERVDPRPLYQDAVSGFGHMFEMALVEGKVLEEDLKESFHPIVEHCKEDGTSSPCC